MILSGHIPKEVSTAGTRMLLIKPSLTMPPEGHRLPNRNEELSIRKTEAGEYLTLPPILATTTTKIILQGAVKIQEE
jgi:hypothetical protein